MANELAETSMGLSAEMLLPEEFRDNEIIADTLNGLIPISHFEKRIIACPEFQRLRCIKQLGFSNLVYPGAEYSRFVHSIGVCHQAKVIVDKVNANLEQDNRYAQYRLRGNYSSTKNKKVPLNQLPLISPIERVVISASALLHDLSHAPFSHEIEGVPPKQGEENHQESAVIPDHDDVAKNPAFFLYLFDARVSRIAQVLRHHNEAFTRSLFEYLYALKKRGGDGLEWIDTFWGAVEADAITEDGFVVVGSSEPYLLQATTPSNLDDRYAIPSKPSVKGFPLLAVMIFEIHLFEKQHEWMRKNERLSFLGDDDKTGTEGKKVVLSFNTQAGHLQWLSLPGWFRAYRKDTIGNTICADLIDYVNRDGYHTGIGSAMDLKFLDRMTIVREILPADTKNADKPGKQPGSRFDYTEIPISCEHIVFDVHDHKRGCVRQSVLTEMLSYLQARYLLCERVYTHRVVEGARAMLQDIIANVAEIRDEGPAGSDGAALSVQKLHPVSSDTPIGFIAPHSDCAFLAWAKSLVHVYTEVTREKFASQFTRVAELAEMLEQRRVFREAVIIDGLHGFANPGPLEGPVEACRRLEKAFLPRSDETVKRRDLAKLMKEISDLLKQAIKIDPVVRSLPNVYAVIGIRKWDKKYKLPLVLVIRPYDPKAENSHLDVCPLFKCDEPKNIQKQLEAMQASFDSLWRVYLFVHPVFHAERFKTVHEKVEEEFLAYANKYTDLKWNNAVKFDYLLGEKAIDIVSFLEGPVIEEERREEQEKEAARRKQEEKTRKTHAMEEPIGKIADTLLQRAQDVVARKSNSTMEEPSKEIQLFTKASRGLRKTIMDVLKSNLDQSAPTGDMVSLIDNAMKGFEKRLTDTPIALPARNYSTKLGRYLRESVREAFKSASSAGGPKQTEAHESGLLPFKDDHDET